EIDLGPDLVHVPLALAVGLKLENLVKAFGLPKLDHVVHPLDLCFDQSNQFRKPLLLLWVVSHKALDFAEGAKTPLLLGVKVDQKVRVAAENVSSLTAFGIGKGSVDGLRLQKDL